MRESLKREYEEILCAYLAGGGEDAIMRASDFARKCVGMGLAPDDVMGFHFDVADTLPTSLDSNQPRAEVLLVELMVSFSMAYRQTMEQLEMANQELIGLSQFKSGMIATVAHDLTNYVTAILLFARAIERMPVETKVREHLHQIVSVTEQQQQLISDLLEYSHIESGRLRLSTEKLDLRAIIQECVAILSAGAPHHAVRVDGPQAWVMADRLKLRQILNNLISNAIKYSPEGGEIVLQLHENEPTMVTVSVCDQGVGIDEEDLPHVFDPFFRAKASPSKVRGTGLGLSIVRSLVLLHGGDVQVVRNKDRGCTFSFSLPRALRSEALPEETSRGKDQTIVAY